MTRSKKKEQDEEKESNFFTRGVSKVLGVLGVRKETEDVTVNANDENSSVMDIDPESLPEMTHEAMFQSLLDTLPSTEIVIRYIYTLNI